MKQLRRRSLSLLLTLTMLFGLMVPAASAAEVEEHTHEYTDEWVGNEFGHWHPCEMEEEGCDAMKSFAAHKYDNKKNCEAESVCSTCDYHKAAKDGDTVVHIWGKGSTKSCAHTSVTVYTCASCKEKLTVPANDTAKLVEGYEETCTENGLGDGWKCRDCGKVLIKQATIKKTHVYEQESNKYGHWDECIRCHATKSFAAHKYDKGTKCTDMETPECTVCNEPMEEHMWGKGKGASCDHASVMTYTCTTKGCGETVTEYDNAILVEGYEATCTENGLSDGWKCADCGKVLVKQSTLKKGHVYATELSSDEYGHWYACTRQDCGSTKSYSAHKYSSKNCNDEGVYCLTCLESAGEHLWGKGKGTSCEHSSVMTYTCTTKGCDGAETVETGSATFVEGEDATCTENGLSDGWKCGECEKVLVKQTTLKKGHVYATELSSDEYGHWYACTREDCDSTKSYSAHKYSSKNCNDEGVYCLTCLESAGEHLWGKGKGYSCAHSSVTVYTCTTKNCDGTATEDTGYALEVEAEPATCTENGLGAGWICDHPDCDEELIKRKVEKKRGHEFSELQTDEDNHWYKCVRCDEIDDLEAHEYKKTTDTHCALEDCDGERVVEYPVHIVSVDGEEDSVFVIEDGELSLEYFENNPEPGKTCWTFKGWQVRFEGGKKPETLQEAIEHDSAAITALAEELMEKMDAGQTIILDCIAVGESDHGEGYDDENDIDCSMCGEVRDLIYPITIIGPNGTMEDTTGGLKVENGRIKIQGGTTLYVPEKKCWIYNGWVFTAEKNGTEDPLPGAYKTVDDTLEAWLLTKIKEGWAITMDSTIPEEETHVYDSDGDYSCNVCKENRNLVYPITIIGPNGEMHDTTGGLKVEDGQILVQGGTTFLVPTKACWIYNGWKFTATDGETVKTLGSGKNLTSSLTKNLKTYMEKGWAITMNSVELGKDAHTFDNKNDLFCSGCDEMRAGDYPINLIGPTGQIMNAADTLRIDENGELQIQASNESDDKALHVPNERFWQYNGWKFTAELGDQKVDLGVYKHVTEELASALLPKMEEGWTITMDSATVGEYLPTALTFFHEGNDYLYAKWEGPYVTPSYNYIAIEGRIAGTDNWVRVAEDDGEWIGEGEDFGIAIAIENDNLPVGSFDQLRVALCLEGDEQVAIYETESSINVIDQSFTGEITAALVYDDNIDDYRLHLKGIPANLGVFVRVESDWGSDGTMVYTNAWGQVDCVVALDHVLSGNGSYSVTLFPMSEIDEGSTSATVYKMAAVSGKPLPTALIGQSGFGVDLFLNGNALGYQLSVPKNADEAYFLSFANDEGEYGYSCSVWKNKAYEGAVWAFAEPGVYDTVIVESWTEDGPDGLLASWKLDKPIEIMTNAMPAPVDVTVEKDLDFCDPELLKYNNYVYRGLNPEYAYYFWMENEDLEHNWFEFGGSEWTNVIHNWDEFWTDVYAMKANITESKYALSISQPAHIGMPPEPDFNVDFRKDGNLLYAKLHTPGNAGYAYTLIFVDSETDNRFMQTVSEDMGYEDALLIATPAGTYDTVLVSIWAGEGMFKTVAEVELDMPIVVTNNNAAVNELEILRQPRYDELNYYGYRGLGMDGYAYVWGFEGYDNIGDYDENTNDSGFVFFAPKDCKAIYISAVKADIMANHVAVTTTSADGNRIVLPRDVTSLEFYQDSNNWLFAQWDEPKGAPEYDFLALEGFDYEEREWVQIVDSEDADEIPIEVPGLTEGYFDLLRVALYTEEEDEETLVGAYVTDAVISTFSQDFAGTVDTKLIYDEDADEYRLVLSGLAAKENTFIRLKSSNGERDGYCLTTDKTGSVECIVDKNHLEAEETKYIVCQFKGAFLDPFTHMATVYKYPCVNWSNLPEVEETPSDDTFSLDLYLDGYLLGYQLNVPADADESYFLTVTNDNGDRGYSCSVWEDDGYADVMWALVNEGTYDTVLVHAWTEDGQGDLLATLELDKPIIIDTGAKAPTGLTAKVVESTASYVECHIPETRADRGYSIVADSGVKNANDGEGGTNFRVDADCTEVEVYEIQTEVTSNAFEITVSEPVVLTWSADSGEDDNTLPAVTGVEFVKRGSNGLDIKWTPGKNAADYSLNYEVFFAKASDGSWVRMGKYSQTDWFLDHCIDLPAGTYNKVRIVSSDRSHKDMESGEFIADISLTINGITGVRPVFAAVSTGAVDEWGQTKYDITISGLPASTQFIMGSRNANGGSGASSFYTDANGNATEDEWMESLSQTEFLVWQCSDVVANGTTASMSRTVYGNWAVVEEQEIEEDDSFISSLSFDRKMRLLLEVNDPDGLYAGYSASLSADGGATWVDLGGFSARSTGYAVNLDHTELLAKDAVQTVYNKVKITANPVAGSTVAPATYTTDCTVTITEGVHLQPEASFTYNESTGEYDVSITGLPVDAYGGYIYYSDDEDFSGWSGHSVSVSDGAITDDTSKDLENGYYYRLNLYGGIAASEMTLSATCYQSGWTLCIEDEGNEGETPAVGDYSIELFMQGDILYQQFVVPEDADLNAFYTYQWYNSADESEKYTNSWHMATYSVPVMPAGGYYDSYRVLLSETGAVLGEGKLAKPVTVTDYAFVIDKGSITVTKGKAYGDAMHTFTFTGLDTDTYMYHLKSMSVNSRNFLSSATNNLHSDYFADGAELLAAKFDETSSGYTVSVSDIYDLFLEGDEDEKLVAMPINYKLVESNKNGLQLTMTPPTAEQQAMIDTINYKYYLNGAETHFINRNLNPGVMGTVFLFDFAKLATGTNTIRMDIVANPTKAAAEDGLVANHMSYTFTVNMTKEEAMDGSDLTAKRSAELNATGEYEYTYTGLLPNSLYEKYGVYGDGNVDHSWMTTDDKGVAADTDSLDFTSVSFVLLETSVDETGTSADVKRTGYNNDVPVLKVSEDEEPEKYTAWYEVDEIGRPLLRTDMPYPEFDEEYYTRVELYEDADGEFVEYDMDPDIYGDYIGYDYLNILLASYDAGQMIEKIRVAAVADGEEVASVVLEQTMEVTEPAGDAVVVEEITVTELTNGRLEYAIALEDGVEENASYALVFRSDEGNVCVAYLFEEDGLLFTYRDPNYFEGSGAFYVVKSTAVLDEDGNVALTYTPKTAGYYYDAEAGEDPEILVTAVPTDIKLEPSEVYGLGLAMTPVAEKDLADIASMNFQYFLNGSTTAFWRGNNMSLTASLFNFNYEYWRMNAGANTVTVRVTTEPTAVAAAAGYTAGSVDVPLTLNVVDAKVSYTGNVAIEEDTTQTMTGMVYYVFSGLKANTTYNVFANLADGGFCYNNVITDTDGVGGQWFPAGYDYTGMTLVEIGYSNITQSSATVTRSTYDKEYAIGGNEEEELVTAVPTDIKLEDSSKYGLYLSMTAPSVEDQANIQNYTVEYFLNDAATAFRSSPMPADTTLRVFLSQYSNLILGENKILVKITSNPTDEAAAAGYTAGTTEFTAYITKANGVSASANGVTAAKKDGETTVSGLVANGIYEVEQIGNDYSTFGVRPSDANGVLTAVNSNDADTIELTKLDFTYTSDSQVTVTLSALDSGIAVKGEEEEPIGKNGYDVTISVSGGALKATITAPETAASDARYTIYFYQTEGDKYHYYTDCHTGFGYAAIGGNATYDAIRLLDFKSASDVDEQTVLADWELDKPIVSSTKAFDLEGPITMIIDADTKGDEAYRSVTFTGLDFAKYPYMLTNAEGNRAWYLSETALRVEAKYLSDAMTITAKEAGEGDGNFWQKASKPYTIDSVVDNTVEEEETGKLWFSVEEDGLYLNRDAEETGTMAVYTSSDNGTTWRKRGSTDREAANVTFATLDEGTYNIKAAIDGVEYVLDQTLTVTGVEVGTAVSATFTATADSREYLADISGLTPNAVYYIRVYDADGMPIYSDTAAADEDGMSSLPTYCDVAGGSYEVIEVQDISIDAAGNASYCTVERGGKLDCVIKTADSYAVSNIRFEVVGGMPCVCWDAPAAEEELRYGVYFLQEGEWNRWTKTKYTEIDVLEPGLYADSVKIVTLDADGNELAEVIDADAALVCSEASASKTLSGWVESIPEDTTFFITEISGFTPDSCVWLSFRSSDEVGVDNVISGDMGPVGADGVFYSEYCVLNDGDLNNMYVVAYEMPDIEISEDGKVLSYTSVLYDTIKLDYQEVGAA